MPQSASCLLFLATGGPLLGNLDHAAVGSGGSRFKVEEETGEGDGVSELGLGLGPLWIGFWICRETRKERY